MLRSPCCARPRESRIAFLSAMTAGGTSHPRELNGGTSCPGRGWTCCASFFHDIVCFYENRERTSSPCPPPYGSLMAVWLFISMLYGNALCNLHSARAGGGTSAPDNEGQTLQPNTGTPHRRMHSLPGMLAYQVACVPAMCWPAAPSMLSATSCGHVSAACGACACSARSIRKRGNLSLHEHSRAVLHRPKHSSPAAK